MFVFSEEFQHLSSFDFYKELGSDFTYLEKS